MAYSSCRFYDEEVNKIVNGIRVADCMSLCTADITEDVVEEEILPKVHNLKVSNTFNCSCCMVSFNDATEQRSHFKLDWHRYNLKRALCNKCPVAEDVFDGLADEVSSISGSETDDSDEDTDNENSESLDRNKDSTLNNKYKMSRHAKMFFENCEGRIFSIYKCLLHSKKETPSNTLLVSSFMNLMQGPKRWLIVMLGGGHFAAAVYSNGDIVQHKTFHCYTVRAKQGGSQSARDNRGGNHPKSAGASLRRYNEQALVQHVQEIMSTWSDSVKQCQLILYRATGPYNRGVLFGGKNPPLEKGDARLRNIPFPTRRATFNEIKRVHDMFVTLEIYGNAAEFKDKFPKSPDKRSPRHGNEKMKESKSQNSENRSETSRKKKVRKPMDRSKIRSSPQREIPGENIQVTSEGSSSDVDSQEGDILITNYMNIPLDELREFEDTVPEELKERRKQQGVQDRRGPSKKRKKPKSIFERQFETVKRKLLLSCEREDFNLLKNTLKMCESLPETIEEGKLKEECGMTKSDFLDCLNSGISSDNRNTVLHISAVKCLPNFVSVLLEAGADPTVKNKNRLTPYVVAGNKETRNSFKEFASHFPNKYDLKEAKIPEPLSEEMQKVYDSKKRAKNRLKREKDKIKKKENKEKRNEEREKERFLALSDREKCALAAERRLLSSMTTNLKTTKPPVLSRCFQCGLDITGKVPFEYGTNRFCSVPCVKSHRLKTNSYGVEI